METIKEIGTGPFAGLLIMLSAVLVVAATLLTTVAVRRLMRWRRGRRALKASWAQTAQSVANAINLTGCGYNATTSGFTGAVTIRLGDPVDYAAVNAFNDAQIKRREQVEAEEYEYGPKPVPYGSKPSEDARPVTRREFLDERNDVDECFVDHESRIGALESQPVRLDAHRELEARVTRLEGEVGRLDAAHYSLDWIVAQQMRDPHFEPIGTQPIAGDIVFSPDQKRYSVVESVSDEVYLDDGGSYHCWAFMSPHIIPDSRFGGEQRPRVLRRKAT